MQQVLGLKARDIERMDLEHEQFRARQQQMMQAELAEAAREQKNVSLSAEGGGQGGGLGMMACGDLVPSKAKIKFEAHEGEIMSTKWEYNGNTTGDANNTEIFINFPPLQADFLLPRELIGK